MIKIVLSILLLPALLFFEGICRAGENGAPSQEETILVVSKSNITEQIGGTYRDQHLAIDAKLKQSIAEKLKARGLNVVAEDDQKKQPAAYVLAYNLVYVKFGLLHPFGRSSKVVVKYVFEKNGETIASGEIAAKSRRSWKKCVNEISDKIAGKIAARMDGGAVSNSGAAIEKAAGRQDVKSAEHPAAESGHSPSEKFNALGFGVSGFMTDAYDDYGYLFFLSHEISVSRHMAVYAKVGYVAYQCDTETYAETARGMGAEIGGRYYPGKLRQQGWYMGLGAGRWWVEGTWKDDLGTPFVTTGKGKTFLTAVNIHTGYKMLFGQRNFYLDPSLQVDSYDTKGTPGGFGQLGITINAAVTAGMLW